MDKQFHWPHGKRLAVSILAMFEVWSEGNSPQYSVQTTGLRAGTTDHSNIRWSQYGGEVGVYRILKTLGDFGLRGTFCTSARCIELFPAAVSKIVHYGHEIGAHGYTQDGLLAYLTPQEQKKLIRDNVSAFETHTGRRPRGWISPVLAWTPETFDLVAAEGLEWYGDLNNFDLPRILKVPSGELVGIPVTEFSDLRVLRSSPRDFFDFYKDVFDYLYVNEPVSNITFVTHCHWGGRPALVSVLRQVLEYMSRFPDVWFTTHTEIAEWVRKLGHGGGPYLDRHPVKPVA